MDNCIQTPLGEVCWETIVTNINWTFVINLVQFFVLVWVLNRLIYRPLLRFMAERQTRLSAQLSEAQQQREAAEALRARRQSELRQAGIQARRMLDRARDEAAELRRRLRAEADAEALATLEAARREAEAELAPVRAGLEAQMARLTDVAVAHVLGR